MRMFSGTIILKLSKDDGVKKRYLGIPYKNYMIDVRWKRLNRKRSRYGMEEVLNGKRSRCGIEDKVLRGTTDIVWRVKVLRYTNE